jgi:creatinine amidohydrolase
MTVYRFETLFPDELQTRLQESPVLVLPFGTIEWHSSHLPLGLDGLVAQGIGERIADTLDAVLMPASYWAVGGVPYPYTLKLPASVIEPLLVATFEQFAAVGFQVIVAFTGHFGLDQTLTLKRAALTVMERAPVTILPLTEYDVVTDIYTGDHAGIGETSLMQTLYPELVRLDAVPADQPLDGIVGADPRGKASAAFGDTLLTHIAQNTGDMAQRLQAGSALERAKYIQALQAGVRILSQILELRQQLPRSKAPGITTPAYIAYCQALARGDYDAAKAHAERKLTDLTE